MLWRRSEPQIDRDEVNLILESLMRIEAKLSEIKVLLGEDEDDEDAAEPDS